MTLTIMRDHKDNLVLDHVVSFSVKPDRLLYKKECHLRWGWDWTVLRADRYPIVKVLVGA